VKRRKMREGNAGERWKKRRIRIKVMRIRNTGFRKKNGKGIRKDRQTLHKRDGEAEGRRRREKRRKKEYGRKEKGDVEGRKETKDGRKKM